MPPKRTVTVTLGAEISDTMLLKFTKMHGLGNHFMVIDAVTQNHIAQGYGGFGSGSGSVAKGETTPWLDVHPTFDGSLERLAQYYCAG